MTRQGDAKSRGQHPCNHQRGGGSRLVWEDVAVVHFGRVQSVAVFVFIFIFVFIVVIVLIIVGGNNGDEMERQRRRKEGTRKTSSAGLWGA